ncbi:tetratricopeptide repeat protein [Magnetovibrio blakemorei]|uniref:tetratricopeptide repeat protein n=1 Tax=Magnetovibrio blakemorei TaxID=28181 RepID=UPI00147CD899|nr:tetratricopeptide repeat protein [Magnetovibrio blakemorei]
MALHQSGQLHDAELIYREILKFDPSNVDANHLLGVIADQNNKPEEAIELISKALAGNPSYSEAHNNLGTVQLALHRLEEAAESFRQAIKTKANYAEAHYNLANVLLAQDNAEGALEFFQKALTIRPGYLNARLNMANVLKTLGRLDEAIAQYRHIIDVAPNLALAHNNLGAAFLAQRNLEGAGASFAQAIALDPQYVDAITNLGSVMRDMGHVEDAIRLHLQALGLQPQYAPAHNNLGNARLDELDYQGADECYNRALSLDPNDVDTHINLGFLNLLMGDFKNGWAHYAWRRRGKEPSLLPRNYPQPLWDGRDLSGKSIFIYPEQGIGDFIQCVRFVENLSRLGGDVTLEVPPSLTPLFDHYLPDLKCIVSGDAIPTFDCHASVMDLPGLLGVDLNALPGKSSYLTPPFDVRASWAKRLEGGKGLRVGLVWAGNPKHKNDRSRSMDPALLQPLSNIEGVALYSFQVGGDEHGVAKIGADRVVDLRADLTDYGQTAAALSCMDVLVSVDTSVAHLGGALGLPTWILLASVTDWRWLLDRSDSPWYPSVRLYRQKEKGAWAGVIDEITQDLRQMVKECGL